MPSVLIWVHYDQDQICVQHDTSFYCLATQYTLYASQLLEIWEGEAWNFKDYDTATFTWKHHPGNFVITQFQNRTRSQEHTELWHVTLSPAKQMLLLVTNLSFSVSK